MNAEVKSPESLEPAERPSENRCRVPAGVYCGLCAAFGALFAISGVTKLLDLNLFRSQVLGYEIIRDPYAAIVAVGLPWIEIFCGVALIFGFLRSGALAILNGLLVVFLIGIISAWVRGLDIECGCFGSGEKGLYLRWVIEDGILLGLGVFLMIVEGIRRGGRSEG